MRVVAMQEGRNRKKLMRATSSLLQNECDRLLNKQAGRKELLQTLAFFLITLPAARNVLPIDCLVHLFLRLSRSFSVASIFSPISSFVLLIDFYHIPGSEQIFTNPTFNESLPSNVKEI
jgi:hypothetical protein